MIRDWQVLKVDREGNLTIPIRFLGKVDWMRESIHKKDDKAVILIMEDSKTIRIETKEESRENPVLAKLARLVKNTSKVNREELAMLRDRYSEKSIRFKGSYGKKPAAYRLLIPARQRQWLELDISHRKICLVLDDAGLQIWRLAKATRLLDEPIDELLATESSEEEQNLRE